ncbi:MAG: hypothetical protein M1826_000360 [Phylliscum demangeonii]|nr:MAG: hypothetical protein M1826_000360 [Phylliscum demangeonii]
MYLTPIVAAVATLIRLSYLTPQSAVRVEPTRVTHLPPNFCGLFGVAPVGNDDTGALREAFDKPRPSPTIAPTPTASIPPAGPSSSSDDGREPVEEEGSAAPVVPERPKTTVTVTIRPATPAITNQFADIAVKVIVEQLVAPAPENPRSSVKEDQTTCDRPSDFGLVILNIVLGACVWWFRGVWGSWWCAIWRCSQAEDVGRPAPREGPGLCPGARLALLQARDGCGRRRTQASTGEGVAALSKRRASDPGSWSVALRATRDGGMSAARGQDEPLGDANWAPPPHPEGATPIAEPEAAPDSPRVFSQEAEGPVEPAEAPPAQEGEPAVEGDSPAEPALQRAEPADDFPPAEGLAAEDPSSLPSGDVAGSEEAILANDFPAAVDCRGAKAKASVRAAGAAEDGCPSSFVGPTVSDGGCDDALQRTMGGGTSSPGPARHVVGEVSVLLTGDMALAAWLQAGWERELRSHPGHASLLLAMILPDASCDLPHVFEWSRAQSRFGSRGRGFACGRAGVRPIALRPRVPLADLIAMAGQARRGLACRPAGWC